MGEAETGSEEGVLKRHGHCMAESADYLYLSDRFTRAADYAATCTSSGSGYVILQALSSVGRKIGSLG